jgi:hypothetical protein
MVIFVELDVGAAVGSAMSPVVGEAMDGLVLALNGSRPMISKVRCQTSSLCSFVVGVAVRRRITLLGRAGIVEEAVRGAALNGALITSSWRRLSRGDFVGVKISVDL